MDDPSKPRIEIFAPFEQAFETTKQILFRPFDLKKWFVIGFPAWLATYFSGGGGFNYNRGFDKSDWNWKAHTSGLNFSLHDMPPWIIPVVIVGALLVIALIVLMLWLNARGRFMFTDCIVRNRGAVAVPWREYRAEGNGFFVFQLVVTFCSLIVFGGLALLFVLGWHWKHSLLPISLLILIALAFFLVALVVGLIVKFMVPVMYRQRCTALEAFRAIWQLVLANPLVFLLFGLFYIVLCIAGAMIGCLAACLTCCLAALPYLGTVILLPLVMFLFTYPLCFIGQFGDPYDVWAVLPPAEPPPLEPPIPPVQQSPPLA